MTQRRHLVLLFNLLQDVNILRPLAFLALRDLDARIVLLVSAKFLERDTLKIWQRELSELASLLNAERHIYASPADAFAVLQGKSGVIVAGSESSLAAHADTHNVFRVAPSGFLKLTLQHGQECVGFSQSREHDIAHGRHNTFAADVVCGWSERRSLKSLAYSERSKLYVTGPSTRLNARTVGGASRPSGGLVCENLHSVRLKATGDFGTSFMEIFSNFSKALGQYGIPVNLRPHPGGQYVLKNKVPLEGNVSIHNLPIYKVDLSGFDYGISAPSTVLIDLLLAEIPVAVWRDGGAVMDASAYDGLTEINDVREWLAFARDAIARPEAALSKQAALIERIGIVMDRAEVYRRYARLLSSGLSGASPAAPSVVSTPRQTVKRVLFLANGHIPTFQLSFAKPLAPLVETGEIVTELVTETEMMETFDRGFRKAPAAKWLADRIAEARPDAIVCCRYSGPHAQTIVDGARALEVPLIYHIDDDLLNIPPEIGERKYKSHNSPERLQSVGALLQQSDLIYASTKGLRRRLRLLGFETEIFTGDIYCAGETLSEAELRPVRKIGYMGFDHAHDFSIILPVLIDYLTKNDDIRFELFGSIPMPAELARFGDRVTTIPPVPNYVEFMQKFSQLGWDIGVCPLARTAFNSVKANTKWVEYSSIGAAVIATRGMVYDECCSEGCGVLADTPDEWLEALQQLTDDPSRRFEMVRRAQARVTERYGPDALRRQVLQALARGVEIKATQRARAPWPHVRPGPMSRFTDLPAQI